VAESLTGADLVGTLRLPARVHVGFGTRRLLPELLSLHGTRVFVVADPFLVGTPAFERLHDTLRTAGFQVAVHTGIVPELPVASLVASAAEAAAFGAESILAIGGGSALDAAKITALLVTHGAPLDRFYGENLVPGPVLPIVAVPTTAGTGSEVTPVAVVSDPARAMKIGVSSPFLIPAAAVVDPELTLGAPASVTAFSGIDALVHAVESSTAADLPQSATALPVFTGRNALTEPLGLDAVARIARWLPIAVAQPDDREARAEMALGALQAGIAFGPTGTHLCHALQYPLGALTHTPHGLGTGLFLPYVVAALADDAAAAERLAPVVEAFAPGTAVADAPQAFADLNARIGVPATLADVGVAQEDLPRIAELALQSTRLLAICPLPVDRGLLERILENAYAGRL